MPKGVKVLYHRRKYVNKFHFWNFNKTKNKEYRLESLLGQLKRKFYLSLKIKSGRRTMVGPVSMIVENSSTKRYQKIGHKIKLRTRSN